MGINVTITCDANPAVEQVTKYQFFDGASKIGESASPIFTAQDVAAGAHAYAVKATNVLGDGPLSDPYNINIPAAIPGKPVNISIHISVS